MESFNLSKLFTEGTARVFERLAGSLPKEVLENNDVYRLLKAKVYNCVNRNFRVLSALYTSNMQPDKNDGGSLFDAVHSGSKPGKCGMDKFFFNDFPSGRNGKGLDELVKHTDIILRQKTDTGAIFRNGDTHSVLKCVFKDNAVKPETVTDVNIVINIFNSELIKQVRRNLVSEYLVNDVILNHIVNLFGGGEGSVTNYSKIPDMLDACEISPSDVDLRIIHNYRDTLPDAGEILKSGFEDAVNLLTSMLNKNNMGYQYIDRLMNEHETVIREYGETDTSRLPDENYTIKLFCFDDVQLEQYRKSYDAQFAQLQTRVRNLRDIIEVIYQDSKSIFHVNDYDDLAKKNKKQIKKLNNDKTDNPPDEKGEAGGTLGGAVGATGGEEKKGTQKTLMRMNERLRNMCSLYPAERKVMEERLSLLEGEFAYFDSLNNPYQFKPGLLVDANITSIKRKMTTLDSMAKILNEFPDCVCGLFTDAALEQGKKE